MQEHQERCSHWYSCFPGPWKHHGPGKRVFAKELFTSACLSSVFSQLSWQDLSLDEIKAEISSLPSLHPLFAPFVVIQTYPNPDLVGTAMTTIPAVLQHEHLLLSRQYHMFIAPWDVTGFFHGVWYFWSTTFSTRGMAVSFPFTFLHEPCFFQDFVKELSLSRAAKLFVLHSLSDTLGQNQWEDLNAFCSLSLPSLLLVFDPVVNCSASTSEQVCIPVRLHRASNTTADPSGTASQIICPS